MTKVARNGLYALLEERVNPTLEIIYVASAGVLLLLAIFVGGRMLALKPDDRRNLRLPLLFIVTAIIIINVLGFLAYGEIGLLGLLGGGC